jgi:hypothetical protein
MNQAIFIQILIQADTIQGEQQPVIAHIRSLEAFQQTSEAPTRTKGPENDQDPRLSGGLGSNVSHLVRMRGLEPPPSFLDTDLNRARLPIPPHPRDGQRRYRTGDAAAASR